VPGVRLISLQVGPGAEQLATAAFPVTDVGSAFNPQSLDDLTAVLSNLDLVVSVESAVAHLAGALGVPVWVLVPLSSDWRWMLERTDSPWYPSMRLFRQKGFGQWDQVFAQIKEELIKLLRIRSAT
jgi:ADP-heptose:LPS heptosyltransferase